MEKDGDYFLLVGFCICTSVCTKPLSTSHGDERDKKGMQGRVKLPCMGYMLLLAPRSIVDWFVVVPTVTVSDCLFHGVQGFCVNVRIPLQSFLSCCLRSGVL